MRIVVSQHGDTIESLVWRELRAAGNSITDTMQLNPGLAERYPLAMPAGVTVILPDATQTVPVIKTITLWS